MKPLRSLFALSLLLVLLFPSAARAQSPGADTYTDPGGRFSVPVPSGWLAEGGSGAVLLTDPERAIKIHVVAVDAVDAQHGIAAAWARVDPSFNLPPQSTESPPAPAGVEQVLNITYKTDSDTRIVAALGQQVQGTTYAILVDALVDAFMRRASQVNVIATGLRITAMQRTSLVGAKPRSITPELTSELETYIRSAMERHGVPGASVAVVQDGQVVYTQGFGVREQGSEDPVTPDTLMMIGSTTKTMTTLMMATLVDEGLMQWDTPVVDILPSFALADPEVTPRLTVQNLVCACTGVPRRDLEIFFGGRPRSAEAVVESLQGFELYTQPGEAFQYSNQMVATGGYIAALAAGGEYGHLYQDYVAEMQRRVFDPIGMPNTTFSMDAARENPDRAMPHGLFLDGSYRPISLDLEEPVTVFAPAGAVWSNARDMAHYLITQLQEGVAPDGTQVVSAENLGVTRTPQIAVSSDTSYALGWMVSRYKGLEVVQHGGNMLGYTTDFAFVPEANLGIVVLTNARVSNPFNEAVRYRLFELAYDQPIEHDAQATFAHESLQRAFTDVYARIEPLASPEELAPYLGTFFNEALGTITLSLRDDALVLETRDLASTLSRVRDEQGRVRYVMDEPPLTGLPFELTNEEDGAPLVLVSVPPDTYRFTPVE